MSVSDTPDHQRGVAAAQQSLGSLDDPVLALPANAETLILHNPTGVYVVNSIVGLSSGTFYPFVALAIAAGSPAGSIYLATVAPALDPLVEANVSGPGDSWWAVADTAARSGMPAG